MGVHRVVVDHCLTGPDRGTVIHDTNVPRATAPPLAPLHLTSLRAHARAEMTGSVIARSRPFLEPRASSSSRLHRLLFIYLFILISFNCISCRSSSAPQSSFARVY
jgi:hypothetical protein